MMMPHLLPTRQTLTATAAIMAIALLNPAVAMAHWGHLGELAGHGHLVAAGLAAAAVAAVGLAVARPQDDAASAAEDSEAEDTEATGDKAHA